MIRRGVMVPVVCLLLGAPAADAATRYASPTGSGPAGLGGCPDDNPCSLEAAIEGSSSSAVVDGDQVLLAPGPYDVGTATLTIGDAITMHPELAGTRPVISGTKPAILQVDGAATVSDIAIVSTPGAPHDDATLTVIHPGAVVERVAVATTASTAGPQAACNVVDGLLRDSTCLMRGGFTTAALLAASQAPAGTYSPELRNVTAWAANQQPSVGFGVKALGANVVIDAAAHNLIANHTSFDGQNGDDVAVFASGDPGATASLTLSNSSFQAASASGNATVTAAGSPTNQTALPQLADPDNGDFHQLAGSPTIDAGAGDPLLGTQDLDFTARVQGAAPDIGADEFASAPPDSVAPSLTIDKQPKNKVKTKKKKAKFSIAFSASEASTFTCALDDKPPVTCTSPYTGKVKKGKHSVEISATDSAGNVSTVATVTWKVKRKKRRH